MLFALVALISIALGVLTYAFDAFRSLELDTVDTRFSIRGDRQPRDDVVVVGVDAKTFEALGGTQSWPFTHDEHAAVVDRLRKDGAKVIAFDIQFSEAGRNTDEQLFSFLESIERAGNVVVSTTEVDELGNGNAFTYYVPEEVLDSKKPGATNEFLRKDVRVVVGNGTLPDDPGGVLRRVPYETQALKSFSVAIAEKARGRPIERSAVEGRTAWIDFYGPPGKIEHISYSDVRLGNTKPGAFRNKVVVIGATAPSLQDIHPTSTSGDGQMAGPEIHAHAVGTALEGFALGDTPTGLDVVLIVLFGLVAPAMSLRLSGVRAVLLTLVVGAVYAGVAILLFNGGTILPFVHPIGTLLLAAVGALGVHYLTEAFERQRTREMFGRFVPESVVGQVLEQSDGARLGGVGRDATVMFSDLRGFTSFAETLEPDQVIAILNRYLTAMVDDAILPHGGTLVDYMGDGIMAVFGAPVEMPDHADRALAAARAKLGELERFNEWLRTEHGFDKGFRMGIGLNSGRVMSGNVGSERRLAYTAIGDTTNTAARLEAMTKGTPYMIYMSESTRASLKEDPADLLFVDEVEVRGREQKVKLWSVEEAGREVGAGAAFESVSRS